MINSLQICQRNFESFTNSKTTEQNVFLHYMTNFSSKKVLLFILLLMQPISCFALKGKEKDNKLSNNFKMKNAGNVLFMLDP